VAGHIEKVKRATERVSRSPELRKRKNEYSREYRKKHAETMRAYGREWMRACRARKKAEGSKIAPQPQNSALEPDSRFKRCFRCAFWMFKGETMCKRCGWK
jgi:hypothetical protein